VACCEVLEVPLLSATTLFLLERLPPSWSSAFLFKGEDCAEVDLVLTLVRIDRWPPVWSLSFVFDDEDSVGVVVDFDFAMVSASGGRE